MKVLMGVSQTIFKHVDKMQNQKPLQSFSFIMLLSVGKCSRMGVGESLSNLDLLWLFTLQQILLRTEQSQFIKACLNGKRRGLLWHKVLHNTLCVLIYPSTHNHTVLYYICTKLLWINHSTESDQSFRSHSYIRDDEGFSVSPMDSLLSLEDSHSNHRATAETIILWQPGGQYYDLVILRLKVVLRFTGPQGSLWWSLLKGAAKQTNKQLFEKKMHITSCLATKIWPYLLVLKSIRWEGLSATATPSFSSMCVKLITVFAGL